MEDEQRRKAETKRNETYLQKEPVLNSCKDLLSLYPVSQPVMTENFFLSALQTISDISITAKIDVAYLRQLPPPKKGGSWEQQPTYVTFSLQYAQ